jgi:2,5-diketo-D-gluconate reductase B
MPPKPLSAPGLGTAGNDDFETCAETVREALELGYRHVDTAQMYGNEAAVGAGIERADVDRADVFVATKILPENLAPEDVHETAHESLERLGLDRVDLLYVHLPIGAYDPERTLPAFDELREADLTRHVGLSNFTPDLLDEAREVLDSPVFAHQVECHPWLPQEELQEYAVEHGHHLVAYCPVLQGRAGESEPLREIGAAHGASPHQVSLAWLLDRDGVVPIPKGTGDHLHENWAAREIELSPADADRIADLDRRERFIDPDEAPWNR